MRIARNMGYVKRRKRLAKLSALAGFILLFSTFFLATLLGPNGVIIAYVPLLVGMILFHFGMQQIAKWNRPSPRNDELIDARLRNLSEKFTVVHYTDVGKRTIEHVLIHPGGALVLTPRDLPGKVVHQNGRWRRTGKGLGRLFGLGGPQLGNPTAETRMHVESLETYLAEAQLEAEVDGAVVFLHPRVELEIEDPDFPVMNGEGLPEFVRTLPEDSSLRPADRQEIIKLLSRGEGFEQPPAAPRRRPVKRRAA